MITRIIDAVREQPWAILPHKLVAIRELLALRHAGLTLSAEDIRARLGAEPPQRVGPPRAGTVAVIPVFGVIAHRMNTMHDISGGTSIEQLTTAFRQARDDRDVGAIVLAFDTPGGGCNGLDDLATEIRACRSIKPVVGFTDATCASAGYWLMSACSEIVATRDAQAGSIGVLAIHEDLSAHVEQQGVKVTLIHAGKYKTEGNPFEPLGEEARAAIQARVDACYHRFVGAVATGRNVTTSAVLERFGGGRVLDAADALAVGMVDRLDTLDSVVAGLQRPPSSVAVRHAAGAKATGQDRTADTIRQELALLEL